MPKFIRIGEVYLNPEHIIAVVFALHTYTDQKTLEDVTEPAAYVFTAATKAERWPSAHRILVSGELLEPFRAWWQEHVAAEVIA